MHKKCPKCKKIKQLTEFNKNKRCKDGLQKYCKICQSYYNRQYYANNKDSQSIRVKKNRELSRQKVYNFLKKYYNNDLKCAHCGESDVRCLQFHHNDPIKKESYITTMCYQGYGIEKIKKELDKCVLLCANCHCKIHNKTRWYKRVS